MIPGRTVRLFPKNFRKIDAKNHGSNYKEKFGRINKSFGRNLKGNFARKPGKKSGATSEGIF